MDHDRYAYSAIVRRAPLKLPNDARVALWVTPNVEHFHYDKPAISFVELTARFTPDVLNYSWRDYGSRVGIFRLIETLARHGIKATAALNAEAAERYPAIIEEGNKQGWEWMAHGLSNSLFHAGLDEATERRMIRATIAAIAAHTGQRPRGWLGPGLTETEATPDFLAEEGIEYVADWVNDELPYELRVRNGRLVALPYSVEIGDIPAFLVHGMNGAEFERMIIDQFDVLYAEGQTSPRMMSIALHPFLVGHPFRIKYLDRALAHIAAHDKVWIATGSEILDWYKAQTRAA
jgi:peptidoglycan/xylan/chitin deacetylase (PgdA/CDA1 family)